MFVGGLLEETAGYVLLAKLFRDALQGAVRYAAHVEALSNNTDSDVLLKYAAIGDGEDPSDVDDAPGDSNSYN